MRSVGDVPEDRAYGLLLLIFVLPNVNTKAVPGLSGSLPSGPLPQDAPESRRVSPVPAAYVVFAV